MYDILELSKKLLPELKDIAKELKIETEEIPSSTEVNNLESDFALRRGKRPRTLKPVVKRSIESVMSVSPDGVKRPETRQGDWQEQVKKPEKADDKPDLFKNPEQLRDNKK